MRVAVRAGVPQEIRIDTLRRFFGRGSPVVEAAEFCDQHSPSVAHGAVRGDKTLQLSEPTSLMWDPFFPAQFKAPAEGLRAMLGQPASTAPAWGLWAAFELRESGPTRRPVPCNEEPVSKFKGTLLEGPVKKLLELQDDRGALTLKTVYRAQSSSLFNEAHPGAIGTLLKDHFKTTEQVIPPAKTVEKLVQKPGLEVRFRLENKIAADNTVKDSKLSVELKTKPNAVVVLEVPDAEFALPMHKGRVAKNELKLMRADDQGRVEFPIEFVGTSQATRNVRILEPDGTAPICSLQIQAPLPNRNGVRET